MGVIYSIFLVFDTIVDFLLTPFRMRRPNWSPLDKYRYIAPKATDLRSPCPFLNTLANHGYINRDGRNLTYYSLTKAQMDLCNTSILLSSVLSLFGLFLCGNGVTVDLFQLRRHDAIEHDASLVHQDISTGNSWSVDPKLVEDLLNEGTAPNALTFHDFARYRAAREATLPAPFIWFQRDVADRESCLTVSRFGHGFTNDPTHNLTSKDRIRSFFLHETFPDDWERPSRPLGFWEAERMSTKLRAEIDGSRRAA